MGALTWMTVWGNGESSNATGSREGDSRIGGRTWNMTMTMVRADAAESLGTNWPVWQVPPCLAAYRAKIDLIGFAPRLAKH